MASGSIHLPQSINFGSYAAHPRRGRLIQASLTVSTVVSRITVVLIIALCLFGKDTRFMFARYSGWQKPRLRLRGRRLVIVRRAGAVSLLLAGGMAARHTQADTIIWTGTTNNLYNVGTNWSAGHAPGAGDTAVINAATVLINGLTINPVAINLNNGAVLDLQNSPTLNVANIVFGNTGANTTASAIYFEGVSGSTPTYTLGAGTTLSGRIGGIGTTARLSTPTRPRSTRRRPSTPTATATRPRWATTQRAAMSQPLPTRARLPQATQQPQRQRLHLH